MSGTHRTAGTRRKQQQKKSGNGGLIALAGVLAAVLVVVLVVVAVLLVTGSDDPEAGNETGQRPAAQGKIPASPSVRTGDLVTLKNSDGFSYRLGAVKGGRTGESRAYIDYVVTNMSAEEVPLELPGDLFVRRTLVPDQARCMEQPGADAALCTPPNKSSVIGVVDGSPPLVERQDDRYMPGGGSYLVRIISDDPVDGTTTAKDLQLYVWDVRFISDRKARPINLP